MKRRREDAPLEDDETSNRGKRPRLVFDSLKEWMGRVLNMLAVGAASHHAPAADAEYDTDEAALDARTELELLDGATVPESAREPHPYDEEQHQAIEHLASSDEVDEDDDDDRFLLSTHTQRDQLDQLDQRPPSPPHQLGQPPPALVPNATDTDTDTYQPLLYALQRHERSKHFRDAFYVPPPAPPPQPRYRQRTSLSPHHAAVIDLTGEEDEESEREQHDEDRRHYAPQVPVIRLIATPRKVPEARTPFEPSRPPSASFTRTGNPFVASYHRQQYHLQAVSETATVPLPSSLSSSSSTFGDSSLYGAAAMAPVFDPLASLSRLRELSRIEEDKVTRVRAKLERKKKRQQKQESQQREAAERLRPPSKEEQERVKKIWYTGRENDVLVTQFNIKMLRGDLGRLNGSEWLNDEVANFYLELLRERAVKHAPKYPRCHVFNSHFYALLDEWGYSRVRTWTRKIDIFAFDKIVIPVHLGNHWCLSVINFQRKRFEYYDSMGGRNPRCLSLLREYVKSESNDKKKVPFDLSGWCDYSPSDIPQQRNGHDCGVFMCKFAEAVMRESIEDDDSSDGDTDSDGDGDGDGETDARARIQQVSARHQRKPMHFEFSQAHMPGFRQRMVLEIVDCTPVP